MAVITTKWLGGEPRVTIRRAGENLTIKLLGSRTKTSFRKFPRSLCTDASDTISRKTMIVPISDTQAALDAALSLSKMGGNCWIWDDSGTGITKKFNEPFDDPIPF